VVDAKLELRANHNRVGPDTVTAQLTIQTGRSILRAEEHAPEAIVAIDRVVDKLSRQVRRFHEKRTDRKGPRPDLETETLIAAEPDMLDELDLDGDESERDAVAGLVRTKRFTLKPMDIEEAIAQMELLGHDFYLFHNAAEDALNVVYRRRDGAYGLLAPIRA
jgi:putative sigma-54 modulation protein